MNTRKIRLSGFGSHADTLVELPDTGLVVVQGANGSGKSSLVEGVAAACWNKSLRGPTLWREGEVGVAHLESDLANVFRERSARGKASILWEPLLPEDQAAERLRAEAGENPEHESAAKAQERLEAVVGSFEVWRRTSVLSSADAAHFALATDSERKMLLEQVLGLDRFDTALAACRADLKQAASRASSLAADERVARATLDAAKEAGRSAAEVLASMAEPPEPGALKARCEKLERAVEDSLALLKAARARMRELDGARGKHEVERGYARREAADLRARLDRKECPACGQAVAHQHADAADKLADAERRAALEWDGHAALEAAEAEVEELADEQAAIAAKRAEAEQRLRDSRSQRASWQRAHEAAASAANKTAAAEREVASVERERVGAGAEVAELEACERVLGMRGVRATMLDRALHAVEVQANAWLRRLAFPGSLALRSTTERKSGSTVDAISLEVTGAGGGKYKGCSAGERRRVDVALLLGLAEVASASRGGRRGDLWADELFDALDAEGIEAAAQALADLSRERKVVVITHSPDLADKLPATLRLRVEGGSVVRV